VLHDVGECEQATFGASYGADFLNCWTILLATKDSFQEVMFILIIPYISGIIKG
jgi:hypothetical protein